MCTPHLSSLLFTYLQVLIVPFPIVLSCNALVIQMVTPYLPCYCASMAIQIVLRHAADALRGRRLLIHRCTTLVSVMSIYAHRIYLSDTSGLPKSTFHIHVCLSGRRHSLKPDYKAVARIPGCFKVHPGHVRPYLWILTSADSESMWPCTGAVPILRIKLYGASCECSLDLKTACALTPKNSSSDMIVYPLMGAKSSMSRKWSGAESRIMRNSTSKHNMHILFNLLTPFDSMMGHLKS